MASASYTPIQLELDLHEAIALTALLQVLPPHRVERDTWSIWKELRDLLDEECGDVINSYFGLESIHIGVEAGLVEDFDGSEPVEAAVIDPSEEDVPVCPNPFCTTPH